MNGMNRKDGAGGVDRLWDSQWVNIVNAPEVLNAENQEDAVNIAVRMTEQKMAENARLREPAGVGGEWVLVPRDFTAEMEEAGFRAIIEADADDEGAIMYSTAGAVYTAMLAAAPQPPAEAQRCTCPSGDGSLRWPCPAHPAEAQAQGGGEVRCPVCYGSGDYCLAGHSAHPNNWRKCETYMGSGTTPPSAPVGVDELADWEIEIADDVAAAQIYRKGWQAGYASAQQPAAVDGAMRAEVERLQAEIDNRWAMGVHTCHENCQRESCVQFRRAERLAEALREARQVVRELLPDATYTKWDAALHPTAAQEGK